jgi:hypothetical protein
MYVLYLVLIDWPRLSLVEFLTLWSTRSMYIIILATLTRPTNSTTEWASIRS